MLGTEWRGVARHLDATCPEGDFTSDGRFVLEGRWRGLPFTIDVPFEQPGAVSRMPRTRISTAVGAVDPRVTIAPAVRGQPSAWLATLWPELAAAIALAKPDAVDVEARRVALRWDGFMTDVARLRAAGDVLATVCGTGAVSPYR